MIQTENDDGRRVSFAQAAATCDRADALLRRTLLWLALLAVAMCVFAAAGCSTERERREHLIRAGKVLVTHGWGQPDWESRRALWLADAEQECPDRFGPVEVAAPDEKHDGRDE